MTTTADGDRAAAEALLAWQEDGGSSSSGWSPTPSAWVDLDPNGATPHPSSARATAIACYPLRRMTHSRPQAGPARDSVGSGAVVVTTLDIAGGSSCHGFARNRQEREGNESTRAGTLGLTSGVLMVVSAMSFSLWHVASNRWAREVRFSVSRGSHHVWCFLLLTCRGSGGFLKFLAKVVVLQYSCHKCGGFQQFTLSGTIWHGGRCRRRPSPCLYPVRPPVITTPHSSSPYLSSFLRYHFSMKFSR